MLTAVALVLLAAARPPVPCPDLTGSYVLQGEDGHAQRTFNQFGCDSLAIRHVIRVYDGTSQVTLMVRFDGHSARFVGDTIEFLTAQGSPMAATGERWYRGLHGHLCVIGGSRAAPLSTVWGAVRVARTVQAAADASESERRGITRSCS